jgi:predicted transposase/invertase (TIGR01784 family)
MLSQVFMNPTNDLVFKRLFGSNDHVNLLISLLSALTGRKIEEITFLGNETVPGNKELKAGKAIIDVYCRDEDKNKFIVEIQNDAEENLLQRFMLYFSRAYYGQLNPKTKLKGLYPVIVVAITHRIPDLDQRVGEHFSHHCLLNVKTHAHDIKDIEFVLVELSKFEKKEAELENDIERWLYFFKHIKLAKKIPASLQHGVFKKACELLQHMRLSEAEQMAYEFSEIKSMSMEDNAENLAAGDIKRAEAKGKAEGELEKARKLAKKMLLKKMPLDEIAEITELSLDEIKKL